MARAKPVTYAELAEALHRLGYKVDSKLSAEDHVTYRHRRRHLPIILQAFKPRAAIRPIYLAAVRHVLGENKAADGREFEA